MPQTFEYFGNTAVPPRQTLKFALGLSPMASTWPASAADSSSTSCSLFEGLISYDPQTMEPAAGLATHYVINRNDTRLTFSCAGN
jgi:hypothetical protein